MPYTEKEYSDAQDVLTWVEGMKSLQISLLDKQTDGRGISAKDYDDCVIGIKECIDDMCYDVKSEAQEIVDEYYSQENRKHERQERTV